MMKIVSSQSEQEIRKGRTADVMRYELRNFAANFLRVVRGAGRAHHVWEQMNSCLGAAKEYHEAHDHWPPAAFINESLDFDVARDQFRPWIKESRKGNHPTEREMIERRIYGAVLQIVASTLIDQNTHAQMAHNALYGAIRELETLREKERREYRRPSKADLEAMLNNLKTTGRRRHKSDDGDDDIKL